MINSYVRSNNNKYIINLIGDRDHLDVNKDLKEKN